MCFAIIYPCRWAAGISQCYSDEGQGHVRVGYARKFLLTFAYQDEQSSQSLPLLARSAHALLRSGSILCKPRRGSYEANQKAARLHRLVSFAASALRSSFSLLCVSENAGIAVLEQMNDACAVCLFGFAWFHFHLSSCAVLCVWFVPQSDSIVINKNRMCKYYFVLA